MSGPSQRQDNPVRRVTVKFELDEPALTFAAFELLHTYARAYGLDGVERCDVFLEVAFEGWPYDVQLEEFKAKVREIQSASVHKVEVVHPGAGHERP